MTELKTLKDIYVGDIIEEWIPDNQGLFYKDVYPVIDKEIYQRLKQEAIKWVKDLDNEDCPACKEQGERSWGWCEDCDTAHVGLHKEDIKEWIIHFFNLTEEDLK